jgi:hypothetical protein
VIFKKKYCAVGQQARFAKSIELEFEENSSSFSKYSVGKITIERKP